MTEPRLRLVHSAPASVGAPPIAQLKPTAEHPKRRVSCVRKLETIISSLDDIDDRFYGAVSLHKADERTRAQFAKMEAIIDEAKVEASTLYLMLEKCVAAEWGDK